MLIISDVTRILAAIEQGDARQRIDLDDGCMEIEDPSEQIIALDEALTRLAAEQAEKVAEERAEDYRRGLYVNTVQLADPKYHEGNIGLVRELLESCPRDLRDWEWDRINHILDRSSMSFVAHQGHATRLFSTGRMPVLHLIHALKGIG